MSGLQSGWPFPLNHAIPAIRFNLGVLTFAYAGGKIAMTLLVLPMLPGAFALAVQNEPDIAWVADWWPLLIAAGDISEAVICYLVGCWLVRG